MTSHRKSVSRFAKVSAVFLGIGFILFLSSLLLQYYGYTPFSSILLSLSISVFSVTTIEMIWRAVGGGPLDNLLEQLSYAVPLLHTFKEAGLDCFYSNRKQVKFEDLLKYIESAKEVDLMAICLRENWTSSTEFMEILSRQTKQKQCRYRMLMLDPGSPILSQRCLEENDTSGRIATTIKDSLTKLINIRNELNKSQKEFLNIRTVSKLNMYCSIVRIDERMVVSFYICSQRGSGSPTMAILGKNSNLFKKFFEEFKKMWESATPVAAQN